MPSLMTPNAKSVERLETITLEFRTELAQLRGKYGRDLYRSHPLGYLLDALDAGKVRHGCSDYCMGSGLCENPECRGEQLRGGVPSDLAQDLQQVDSLERDLLCVEARHPGSSLGARFGLCESDQHQPGPVPVAAVAVL